jgi:hypothetical protein
MALIDHGHERIRGPRIDLGATPYPNRPKPVLDPTREQSNRPNDLRWATREDGRCDDVGEHVPEPPVIAEWVEPDTWISRVRVVETSDGEDLLPWVLDLDQRHADLLAPEYRCEAALQQIRSPQETHRARLRRQRRETH